MSEQVQVDAGRVIARVQQDPIGAALVRAAVAEERAEAAEAKLAEAAQDKPKPGAAG
jgi:hypothetical protein